MAKKSNLILVVSESMDNNKKPDRNEQALIRCSGAVRDTLSFPGPIINVKGEKGGSDVDLKIHQAFSKDIRVLKESGKFSSEQLTRIGFVTSDVFRRLSNRKYGALKVTFKLPELRKILVGADPEFLLFDAAGKVVHANNHMQKNGPIGSDGAMMEVRPDPSDDPNRVVRSIRDIFADRDLTSRISEFDWKAEVYYKNAQRDFPVGGHIHIGNPTGISRLSTSEREYLFAVLNKILDELLSVPMIRLDGTYAGKARRTNCMYVPDGNQGFGFFGGWRECDGRLEHRTLSGLWLTHPTLAYFVLGTAKAIAEAAYGIVVSEGFSTKTFTNPSVDIGYHKRLYRSDCSDWGSNKLAEALGCIQKSSQLKVTLDESAAEEITISYLKRWRRHMKTLSTYNKYSGCIDGLYDALRASIGFLNEKVGTDLKKNWLKGNDFTL